MRLFRWLKLLGLVLALSTVTPVVSVPFQSSAEATTLSPPTRRTGDPDMPEWTNPRPSSNAPTPEPWATWRELLLRLFRGGNVAE